MWNINLKETWPPPAAAVADEVVVAWSLLESVAALNLMRSDSCKKLRGKLEIDFAVDTTIQPEPIAACNWVVTNLYVVKQCPETRPTDPL